MFWRKLFWIFDLRLGGNKFTVVWGSTFPEFGILAFTERKKGVVVVF